MPRLIWSPSALRDVARFHAFLKSKSPEAAARGVKAIREGVKILAQHPEAGRPIEDLEPEFRDWLIEFGDAGYIVRYRYDLRDIVLLAVRHMREVGF